MEKDNNITTLEVETSFGTIVAEKCSDPEFPAISIFLRCKDDVNGEYERDLVVVENTPMEDKKHNLRVLVWGGTDEEEDYTNEFLIRKD